MGTALSLHRNAAHSSQRIPPPLSLPAILAHAFVHFSYIVLDVRTPAEYAERHIPGAINVPNETIGSTAPEQLPDRRQLILVYCRSGNRSKQAADKLAALGYTNIVEFGGINSWQGETVAGDE